MNKDFKLVTPPNGMQVFEIDPLYFDILEEHDYVNGVYWHTFGGICMGTLLAKTSDNEFHFLDMTYDPDVGPFYSDEEYSFDNHIEEKISSLDEIDDIEGRDNTFLKNAYIENFS